MSFIIGTIGFVLTFGIAVFVHELGHMLFALACGVGVESFAIGMGPKICAWRWWNIEFSLRWLPVGGFVKLHGMYEDEETDEDAEADTEDGAAEASKEATSEEKEKKSVQESTYDDMLALQNKGLLTKILVFGGGVFMNFIAAIVAMAFFLWVPHEAHRNLLQVETVAPSGIMGQAGLQAEDTIVAFNDEPVTYQYQFAEALDGVVANAPGDAESYDFSLTVARGEGEQTILVSVPRSGEPEKDFKDFYSESNFLFHIESLIGDVNPLSPAERGGLESGDRVVEIDGKSIQSFQQLKQALVGKIEVECQFVVERDGERVPLTLIPTENPMEDGSAYIGVSAGSSVIEKKQYEPNFLQAIVKAPWATVMQFKNLMSIQGEFFSKASGSQIRENLGGPLAIIAVTANRANQGLSESLNWFINLNLLLLFFNLLPFPILDGGFIVISIIESIIRRPIPPKVLNPIFTVFFVILIGFVFVVSFNDVYNILFRK